MADDKLRATPAARKLADDLGINLYDVSGSGANGRVHKKTWKLIKKQTWFAFRHLQNELPSNIILLGRKSKEPVIVVKSWKKDVFGLAS